MPDAPSSDASRRDRLKRLLRAARTGAPAPADDRIAVIGMAGRYPGAPDLDTFWTNLAAGRNCVSEVPPERWDWRRFDGEKASGKDTGIYTRWGGFLEGVDEFDPLFFSISPLEAQAMDPQERLFLQTAWHALEDAGQTRRKLAERLGGEVGVFVGVMNSHYEWLNAEARLRGSITGAHSHFWSLANRLSYFLNLTGPSFAVDSACSASLTAIHLACESLRRGECRAAIAGGVNLILHPLHYHKLCLLEMLSPDGACKAFGAGADGFVDGEGVGAVVLKPLAAALADGDPIHGVILGSAINSGGKTAGFTVPNPQAQKQLVRRALARASAGAASIGYIEAHGTGTRLGDPIELAALSQVWAEEGCRPGGCPIGSVKSNIGHLESAAGVAGLTKVLLQLRHRALAPSIHTAELNPKIDWMETPFVVQRGFASWPAPGGASRRRAGVSSFGAGGANAHVIVEEFSAGPVGVGKGGPEVIVLSARTEDGLRRAAGRLAAWLAARAGCDDAPALADVAFTLQTGREPMEARVAFVASSLADAAERLKHFLAAQTGSAHHACLGAGGGAARELIGADAAGRAFLAGVMSERDGERLARLWVAGAEIDWSAWHEAVGGRPRVISLPGYPFATDRYWIGGGGMTPVAPAKVSSALGQQEDRAAPAAAGSAALMGPASAGRRGDDPSQGLSSSPRHSAAPFAASGAALTAPSAAGRRGDGGSPGVANLPQDDAALSAASSSAPTAPFAAGRRGDGGSPGLASSPSDRPASFAAAGGVPAVTVFAADWSGPEVTGTAISAGCGLQVVAGAEAAPEIHAAWRAAGGAEQDLRILTPDEAVDCEGRVLWAGSSEEASDNPEAGCSALLRLLRQWTAADPAGRKERELIYAARGADPMVGAAGGLLRSAAAETTNLDVRVIAVDATGPEAFWRATLIEVTHPHAPAADVRLAASARSTRRWHRLDLLPAARAWRDRGVYVITGGLGGLGRLCARHLARTCSARLALVGRSECGPQEEDFLAELRRLGGDAAYLRADLADRTACDRAWREIKARFGAVHGILHAAGVSRDGALVAKTPEDVAAVFAGKVTGLRNLEAASAGEPLDVVVLFGSVAGVLGNAGQADYAAANGFLDAWAAERNRQVAADGSRGRAVAISWPWWSAGRMHPDEAHAARAQTLFGLEPLPEAAGLAVLDGAVASGREQILVWSGDPAWVERALDSSSFRPAAEASPAARPVRAAADLTARTEDLLKEMIATPIKLAPDQIDSDRRLSDYGIDSVMIRAFNARLEERLPGVPASVLFEYPTVRDLARHLTATRGADLERLIAGSGASAAAAAPATLAPPADRPPDAAGPREVVPVSAPERETPPRAEAGEPIAIVGLSGRYPGARNPDEFWDNLAAGRDGIREVPPERWDARQYQDGDPAKPGAAKAYCQRGGFLDDVDKFDPLFFGISPLEAKAMDPQERIFLELAWEAIEDAGYTRATLDRNTGVFAGVTTLSYALHGAQALASGAPIIPSSVPWSLANRVSFVFDLTGPSIPVDTACSASLTAIHFACESLRRGECRAALVGGINLYLHPLKYLVMCQTRMLSASGYCHSFGESGDGFIPGEGGGVILLKPLSAALAAGDRIHGLVRGTAINHGGRTNGYTVPNPRAQADLIRRALAAAGVNPRTIGYLEAHGTGTVLGDPIELEGLTQAFRDFTADRQFCALGSVKSNIGHLESAAGIAGVTKVLLQMKHGRFAPTLHAEVPNRHIDFAGSPFVLQREGASWPPPGEGADGAAAAHPRRAGVSSFGAGGANAHVILEEYPAPPAARRDPQEPQLLVLSARDRTRLSDYARRLGDRLAGPASCEFADLAYTLQVGREAFSERLAVVAATAEEANTRIAAWLAAPEAPTQGVFAGRAAGVDAERASALGGLPGPLISNDRAAAAEFGGPLTDGAALDRLAVQWIHGRAVEWEQMHAGRRQRVSAPTYPFARERYWFDDAAPDAPPAAKPWYSAMPGEQDFGPPGEEVSLETVDGAVALVTMRDRANHNMFSERLLRGLLGAFSEIRRRPEFKVVVVTGCDHVFSMGGSREGLLGLAEQKARFTDVPFLFRGFLECPLPVVAAVQGHASGGGLLFGLYADFPVLAEEGVYASNFLNYGFTPGMGATLILPERLGPQLAAEMLFTAAGFTGEELRRRGAPIRVRPAAKVLGEALELARSLAEKPAPGLRELKREWAGRLLARMPDILARELAMHERTIGTPEVRARIEATFARGQPAAAVRAGEAAGQAAEGSPRTFEAALHALQAQKAGPETKPEVAATAAVASAGDQEPAARAFIVAALQRLLHLRREAVELDVSFKQLGLDSISGVELVRDLNRHFGLNLEAAALYDHSTVATLAAFVSQRAARGNPARVPASSLPQAGQAVPETGPRPATRPLDPLKLKTAAPAAAEQPFPEPFQRPAALRSIPLAVKTGPEAAAERPQSKIALKAIAPAPDEAAPATAGPEAWPDAAVAVVGLACRFPGADDAAALWRNLLAGADSTGPAPAGRWPAAQPDASRMTGGFVADVDQFDAEFFRLLPIEAEYMEPQQRLFLEECWKALEDAGFGERALAGRKCGVFVGAGTGDYFQNVEWARHERGIAHAFTGGSPSILAARISYHLDLTGPSVALDTACSSSLVAVHQACRSLLDGDADLALAGGVSLMLTPQTHVMTGKAGMLSASGRCRPFDRKADGIVISEGVGVVVLQRLSRARAERRQIYGVIRGSAVNQDGRTNGITAPSARAQAALLAEAQARAGLRPEDVTFIEAHGTGTALGDPIEVAALRTVFGETAPTPWCALGSVKSNLGHTMLAAGAAGLIKTLLALRHRTIPPTAHFEAENEHLRLAGSPFRVNRQPAPWTQPPNGRRIAGVSSFGFSGTNAHVIVEEWAEPRPAATAGCARPILVSARDEAGLRARLRELRAWLDAAGAIASLDDIAHSLAYGRSHYGVRWAAVAASVSALAEALDAALADPAGPGAAPSAGASAEADPTERACRRYREGGDVPAEPPSAAGRTISIPGYPLRRRRYWIEDRDGAVAAPVPRSAPEAAGPDSSRSHPAPSSHPPAGRMPPPGASLASPANGPTGPSTREPDVVDHVRRLVAEETKLDPAGIDVTADFEACGLNSIVIAALNRRLEADFGALPATLFFTYKSVDAVAGYLAREHRDRCASLGRAGERTGAVEPTPARPPAAVADRGAADGTEGAAPIAIIGMAGRFPQAADLDEFWANLKGGRDCVGEIPPERWDYRRFWTDGAGKRDGIYCKWGGFIAGADRFDAAFFNIAPREARFMDPQERLFLECVWHCLEDAGYTRARLQDPARGDRRAPVGVFAGVSLTDYQMHGGEAWGRGEISPVNSQIYAIANRVSYFLNLGGPSLPVDTACSSSLYALHLACESLRSGGCRMAFAGGVNLSLHPNKYLTLCLGQFAASDGRCHAFGDGGDGYVPAEGVGAVLLKPLADAVRDGDRIHAVIRGTAVNHDGKTHGFSVPNPVAQTEVIRQALAQAGLTAEALSYVEAHGTGTALGDPIEIAGLSAAFAPDTARRQFCSLGSVKSNIGHAEAAAGIAQLIKVVLQMRHRTLAPNLLHSGTTNPRIDFPRTPFFVQTTCAPWEPAGGKRCAGLSSFGVGGVNVHAILEEAPAAAERTPTLRGPFVLPLSGKSEWSVREGARRLREFLTAAQAAGSLPPLADVAYTLQVGREAMPVRAAVVAATPAEALARLAELESGTGPAPSEAAAAMAGEPFGADPEDRVYLRQLAVDGKWEKLARRWADGARVDWDSLVPAENRPRRISLPGYAFQRERYWQFEAAAAGLQAPAALSAAPSFPAAPADGVELRRRLAAADAAERLRVLTAYVQEIVGELLAFAPPNTAPLDKGLFELGMESVQNAQLVARLAGDTGAELYPTVTFDYPNVRALATHLAHKLAETAPAPAVADSTVAPDPREIATILVQEAWEPANLAEARPPPRGGEAPVLLLAHDDDARAAVEASLRARGDGGRVVLVKAGLERRVERDDVVSIDPREPADYAYLVDLVGGAPDIRVLHGWSDRAFSPHPAILAAQLERAPDAVFHLTQALLRRTAKGTVRLVSAVAHGGLTAPHAVALRALLRSVTQENPAYDYRLAEFVRDGADGLARGDWAACVDELLRGPDAGASVRHEPGRRLVRVLREFVPAEAEAVAWPERPVVLIAGGLGGLGLVFACHLAQTRSARLVLGGRTSVAAHDPRIRRLEQLGAEVHYVCADVGRRGDAEAMVAAARERWGAVHAVIHAAGVIRDAFVPAKEFGDWRDVLAPKVHGTVHLDEATRGEPLRLFMVLSSLTAAVGNAGQTDYAYANAFQQEFIRWRAGEAGAGRRAGHSLAVNWPLWADGGMKVEASMLGFLRDVIGLELLPTAEGLRIFERAIQAGEPAFTVVHGVRAAIARHLGIRLRSDPPAARSLEELERAVEAELAQAARILAGDPARSSNPGGPAGVSGGGRS